MADNRKELETVLWAGADVLRSKMDANEYKDYLLSFVFYKYLSDTFLVKVYDLLNDCAPESIEQAQQEYEEAYEDEDAEDLLTDLRESCRYVIEPGLTFCALAKKVSENTFQREELKRAFNDIENSDPLFANLFQDVDLYANRLGVGDTKQSATVAELVKVINQADILHAEGDVLGNAYEYLIGQFASETGKKAGEFYTPAGPAEILTRIAIDGQEDKQGLLVYDPCMGSASLLLDARKFSNNPEYIHYFGQELMTSTYNLARMNMFLHGIAPENQTLRNGDTLDADWPTTEETEFDMVVMNPPYSAKWSANKGFLSNPRFMDYGVLAPKSKADYAFLLHGFYHLKPTGTMGIVLPHGVLFRGGAEGTIRQKLLEEGSIYAVIGLPANMFYNTSIPTCILVLKKQRSGRDVLFLDASSLFEKKKTRNEMNADHINRVLELYRNREDVDKVAHLASYDEIRSNDFNLNIPRYVDTFEEEAPIDLAEVNQELRELDTELAQSEAAFRELLGQLRSEDSELMGAVNSLISIAEDAGGLDAVAAFAASGVSCHLFPRKGEKTPRLRFAGFSGEWKEKKLGEIVERVTRKNQDLESELPLTISAQYGLIDQNEFFDRRIASKDVSGYYLIRNGEFAYNKSTSTDAPWGAIKRLDKYEKGVLSTLYIVFRIIDDAKVYSDYLVSYYDTNIWHKDIVGISAEGARNHGLLNIAPSDFFNTRIVLPQYEEQRAIGNFLSKLDHLITTQQRKLETLKRLKQFMLQNLFV